ncbi:PDZ domain-containing protein 9-like [Carcharodon carcharias]|uniref:PDZ domain-containing protein 9-like n=1 Tax=Carcharodon carcharias TaxID=13397 RepID=UPI001B7DA80F|nr:PDZ domain-containing protein 9-like [Carcharodon carcharias]
MGKRPPSLRIQTVAAAGRPPRAAEHRPSPARGAQTPALTPSAAAAPADPLEPGGDMKENPEHNLGPSLKTLIKKDVHGLGLVLIEHGSFLQIVSIVGDSSGDSNRATNLKPGDILVKIGNKNVLGYSLRELRHLVGEIPIGTQLQLIVYRNYKELPENWKAQAETIHSNESIQEGETGRSSSSDEDDKNEQSTVKFKNFRPLSLFWHDMGIYIPPISRAWHAPKKNQSVLLVGPHVDFDIVFHQAFEDDAISNDGEEEVPNLDSLWSALSYSTSSTSSSSSPTDSQWIHQFNAPSSIGGKYPLGKSSQQGPSPHPEQPIKVESLEGQKQGEEVETTESTTDTTTLESSISFSTESLLQNSQSLSLNTSTQSNDTDSETSTSIEDQMAKSSGSDTTVDKTHSVPGKRRSRFYFKMLR